MVEPELEVEEPPALVLPPEAPSGFWVADDGLWVAAAIGSYTHVRLTAQSAALLYPLRQVAR